VVGVRPGGLEGAPASAAALVDLVVADPEPVVAAVETAPQAAVTLALVLRASLSLSVPAGLAAESAAYSMLQAGPEFARWRATRLEAGPERGGGRGASSGGGGGGAGSSGGAGVGVGPPGRRPAVVVERAGADLAVTLWRPERHNAVDTAMRDGLVEALLVAGADPSIGRVVLAGAGPSFC